MGNLEYRVVVDSEGFKSVAYIENGTYIFWDDLGGHSEGSKEYFEECQIVNDFNYLKKYFDLYDIKITKDNIALYYEFMSDEDLERHKCILTSVFGNRVPQIYDALHIKHDLFIDPYDQQWNNYKTSKEISVINPDGSTNTDWVECTYFGIKDILQPIDEFIEEAKASDEYKEYKEYINKDLKTAYRFLGANDSFYFIDKKILYLGDNGFENVNNYTKIKELEELRYFSSKRVLILGKQLQILNDYIAKK